MPLAFGFGWFGFWVVGFRLCGFWLVGFGLFGFWLVTMVYEVPLRVTGMDVKHRNEWNWVTTLKL